MAKALITPSKVSYYEKINNTYFEGDFSMLSNWLGTDLNFNKVQNLLIGEAFDDLREGKYTQTIVENLFRLEDQKDENIKIWRYISGLGSKNETSKRYYFRWRT